MKPIDLARIAAHESIMTLIFIKKDGSIRKVLASRSNLMYDAANAAAGHTWMHEGTPSGCFSFVDVKENKWKRLTIENLIAVKRADGTVFCTTKKALKAAEKVVGRI